MPDWPPDYSRSRAVLIGTSEYTGLTQVPAAAHSLARMRQLLVGPHCEWPERRVQALLNERRNGDLPNRLIDYFADAVDVALFYYVGHGLPDYSDQLCLALVDSRNEPERRATTSLTFDAVRHALGASEARIKIVILDCCFAGLAVRGDGVLGSLDVMAATSGTGAYTVAASGERNTAWFENDPNVATPHTYFTKHLVEIVERGIPGRPATLTLDMLVERLTEDLLAAGKPRPTHRARDAAGRMPFARNAAPTESHIDYEVLYRQLLGEPSVPRSEDGPPTVPAAGIPSGGAGVLEDPVADAALSAATERAVDREAEGNRLVRQPPEADIGPVHAPFDASTSDGPRGGHTEIRSADRVASRTGTGKMHRGRALAGVLAVLVLVAGGFAAKEWGSSRAGPGGPGVGWARLSVPANMPLDIGGVSCPTPGFCMVTDTVYAYTLSHGAWQPARKVSSFWLGPVSCASDSFCVAGGGITTEPADGAQTDLSTFYTYSGGTWSSAQLTGPGDGRRFDMLVSCAATDFCMAVGGVDAYTYSDGRWSAGVNVVGHELHGVDTTADDELAAVSCVSRDWCLAVDGSDAVYTYSAGVWAPAPRLDPPKGGEITGLSCASPSFCAAPSIRGFGVGILSDGRWSTYPLSAHRLVSCPAVGFCLGVDGGDAYAYADGRWSDAAAVYSPVFPDSFEYLSCASTRYCLATTLDRNVYVYSPPAPANSRSSPSPGRTP
jgi:Caspase domain